MKDGFIRVSAATPEIKVADCGFNTEKIINMAAAALGSGSKLVVFPELCVTGYTCGDLFNQRLLTDAAFESLLKIRDYSASADILIIVGLPLRVAGKLYNCAAVIKDGKILGLVPKSNIPNYNEFYELRHFTSAPGKNIIIDIDGQPVPFGTKLIFSCAELAGFSVSAEICEDLWVPCPPSVGHAAAGANIIANLSASDETIGKDDYRRLLVSSQSARLVCGYIYSDAGNGESSTDMVFAGHNLIAENGAILAENTPFENGLVSTELDILRLDSEQAKMNTFPQTFADDYLIIPFSTELARTPLTRPVPRLPFVPRSEGDRQRRCEAILSIQAAGLKKRIEHTGTRNAVIGVSGGLDSTLAMLVTARAMDMLSRPRGDILAVTMPCFGTTKRTKSNAEILSSALGASFREIDITASVLRHFEDISHDPALTDVTYENSQARERTQVLMDIANQTGGLVVGTGDLSELALGWATYNGDHMSMYGVNASVPKTLIRHIIKYVADSSEDTALKGVLYDILDTPVSPELLPAKDGEISQITEELVGPYELHDFFLYYIMRWGFPPLKVLRLAEHAFDGAYSRDEILKWLKVFCRRFFSQQFKRSCLPDGPKVGSVSLSPRGDWRMPSDASSALWLDELERI